MDSRNRFESPGTYLVSRLEYFAALVVCITLAAMHIGQIRWIPFIVLFSYIDLIGYIPGAIAYRRAQGGAIPLIYFALYNSMHNFLVGGLVAGLWTLAIGPEWALMAIPIHLCGDRSLFGNSFKPWGISFEPKSHPAFERFEREFSAAQRGGDT